MPEQRSWADKLQVLFATRKPNEEPAPQVENPESRRTGETYEQWGTRICGIVSGNLISLPPNLHRVYNYTYNEQATNAELQEQFRRQIQADIDGKNEEIRQVNGQIADAEAVIGDKNKKIEELNNEKQTIQSGKEEVNKDQRLKLIIGLCIIVPLTLYLFLFYSSTFYSAFFREAETMENAMNAMFDSNALANAYADGWAEWGFVLSAPIIFLGLGFVLHFFSVQEGKMKYLKMAAILLVTVMFDCILAYKIGDQLHTYGIIIGKYPIGQEYTAYMAFHDINTWAVIFCGFIVYVIWGIVFDMCMSAYDKMDLNKTRLNSINQKKNDIEKTIQDKRNEIANLRKQESDARNSIQQLMGRLGDRIVIDYSSIRTEMNNFFAGWLKQMQVLSIGNDIQEEASEIYKREMAVLIPSKQQ